MECPNSFRLWGGNCTHARVVCIVLPPFANTTASVSASGVLNHVILGRDSIVHWLVTKSENYELKKCHSEVISMPARFTQAWMREFPGTRTSWLCESSFPLLFPKLYGRTPSSVMRESALSNWRLFCIGITSSVSPKRHRFPSPGDYEFIADKNT